MSRRLSKPLKASVSKYSPQSASYTSSSKRRRIHYGCAGDCRSARCVSYKDGISCTIYCHRRSGECPNKATGSSYTQIAVIEQDEQDEEDGDDEMEAPFGFSSC